MLVQAGYLVHAAATGSGGIDLVSDAGPDLVILDLGLPDLDGLEVLSRIRPITASPILILSGRTGSTAQLTALSLGADGYVTKPFRPKDLLARISAVMARPRTGDTHS